MNGITFRILLFSSLQFVPQAETVIQDSVSHVMYKKYQTGLFGLMWKPEDIAPQNIQNSDTALKGPRKVKKILTNRNNAVPGSRRILKRIRVKSKEKDPANSNDPSNAKENSAIEGKEIMENLLGNYASKWRKQQKNIESFRSVLRSSCTTVFNVTVTQENSPVGTTFVYDGDSKRTLEVTPDVFEVFPKENPFKKAPWDTCAVVGNGGILANSSCGKEIDSATFVIRCNLPPLKGFERDTGTKTNLVTANPSILVEKYKGLTKYRRPFVNDMQLYGDALILLPAFSYKRNTDLSLRAAYSLEDLSGHGPQAIFSHPKYLKSLATFWQERGVQSLRLSTGIMMASLAVELCNNVHLYGFWPFETHPYTRQEITNHYYNNRPVNKRMHAMPAEFEALLNLHNKGVIHLHLEECTK